MITMLLRKSYDMISNILKNTEKNAMASNGPCQQSGHEMGDNMKIEQTAIFNSTYNDNSLDL